MNDPDEYDDDDYSNQAQAWRRQRRVGDLVDEDESRSNREIARMLKISHVTVASDRRAIRPSSPDPEEGDTTVVTTTTEANDELAQVRLKLAMAEEKVANLEAQSNGKAGPQTHDRRARMPTSRLRSGSLPENAAGDGELTKQEIAALAERIFTRQRGY